MRLSMAISVTVVVAICSLSPAQEVGQAGKGAHVARSVYFNDFTEAAGAEWSNRNLSVTPSGKDRFLGQFAKTKVSLTLKKLPAHKFVRISFDLYVIGSWDGYHAKWGPDPWMITVTGGPVLMETSFSYDNAVGLQAFPDDLRQGAYPAQTGAASLNKLGFLWNGKRADSVYKFSFTFPHTADAVGFDFSATGNIVDVDDESWGLDNVKVEVLGGPVPAGPKQFQQLWEQLGGKDPMEAHRAKWRFVAAGKPAAAFLRKHLSDKTRPVDQKELARLIAQLGDDNWRKRDAASEALIRMGRPIQPIIQNVARETASQEVRIRANDILKSLTTVNITPVKLRRYRAEQAISLIEGRFEQPGTRPVKRAG